MVSRDRTIVPLLWLRRGLRPVSRFPDAASESRPRPGGGFSPGSEGSLDEAYGLCGKVDLAQLFRQNDEAFELDDLVADDEEVS